MPLLDVHAFSLDHRAKFLNLLCVRTAYVFLIANGEKLFVASTMILSYHSGLCYQLVNVVDNEFARSFGGRIQNSVFHVSTLQCLVSVNILYYSFALFFSENASNIHHFQELIIGNLSVKFSCF